MGSERSQGGPLSARGSPPGLKTAFIYRVNTETVYTKVASLCMKFGFGDSGLEFSGRSTPTANRVLT